jgi:NAD(P)-dependent dehydrogenase (short-subunit alcohol dehydrogenase family)
LASVEYLAVALVTGGARRIGRAIVEDLARNGFAVAIHCNNSRREAERLADELRQAGRAVAVLQADLTLKGETAELMSRAEAALGPVRLLVNSASIFEDDSARAFGWDAWDRHFDIHLKAPVMLTRAFAAALPADATGLVVNIIDQRVLRPNPRFFSYTLSKAALWTATQTMAQEFAPRIRVNAIGPGPTFANPRQEKEDFEAQLRGLLLKKGPAPAEFGAAIRYLWGAGSVTGQMIALDGGQHLAWQTPDVTGMRE